MVDGARAAAVLGRGVAACGSRGSGPHVLFDHGFADDSGVAGASGGAPQPSGNGERPASVLTDDERRSRDRANIIAALEACGGKVFGPAGAAARRQPMRSTLTLQTFGLAPCRVAVQRVLRAVKL